MDDKELAAALARLLDRAMKEEPLKSRTGDERVVRSLRDSLIKLEEAMHTGAPR